MRIKVNHITQWAKERECQDHLPLLIKKLILASSNKITNCDFPSVDQVYLTGFDGIAENDERTLFVPEGISVWEMGCSNDWRDKANEDYLDRKNEPLGMIQKNTTYIQVSPQLIERAKREDWVNRRIKQNVWKDVKLYGALELETWINETPSVQQWFTEILGLPTKGVETLERWWSKWCQLDDDLKISPEMVLIDKENEVEKLIYELRINKKIMVKSSNIEESIAFLYASISTLPKKDLYLSNTLVIHDKDSMDFYSQFDNLILIPTYDNYEYYQDGDNIIYIPINYTKHLVNNHIKLKDSFRPHFVDVLEKIGISNFNAKKYARECGANLTILKRILNQSSNIPDWMEDKNIQMLKFLFFIQSCDGHNIYDKKIIEEISGLKYELFLQNILLLSGKIESPILKNNRYWHLKSPKEVFFHIGKYITPYDLDRFRKVVLKVFKKNPIGSIKNRKFNKCSDELKKGILKSLILISVYGENIGIEYIDPKVWVDNLISELFINENDSFFKFNAMFLKFFSEASPDSFLRIIKEDLENENPNIYSIFPIGCNESKYIYLLNALEIISWDKYKFHEVINVLLKLSELNCNYFYHNQPKNTLKELFISWKVNTFATPSAKLKSLNEILNKNLNIGWDILTFLLSHESSVSMGVTEPLYRNFSDEYYSISSDDKHDYENNLRKYLLEFCGFDSTKWSFILSYSIVCNNREFQNSLLDKLMEVIDKIDDKKCLWNQIRNVLYKYGKLFGENDYFNSLKDIYIYLTPENLIDSYDYLFNDHTPFSVGSDINEIKQRVNEERSAAINEIIKNNGISGIITLVQRVEYPHIIGEHVSNYDFDDEVFEVLGLNDNANKFAMSYIYNKSESNPSWIDDAADIIKSKKWDNIKITLFFVSLKYSSKVSQLLNDFGNDIQELYWKSSDRYFICEDAGDGKNYVSQLIKHSKFNHAILFLWDNFSLLSGDFVGNSLCEMLSKSRYDLKCDESLIMEILEKLNEDRYDEIKLMRLEFYFSHCFRYEQPTYSLKIHKKMSENPEIICNLIEGLFDDNKNNDYKNHCYDIFETWKIVPGTDSRGVVNYKNLVIWFNSASELLNHDCYIQLCRIIGELFANTPEDEESWPMNAICRFIEDNNIKKINNNFLTSIIMKWSCYSKSILDGGDRERKIAKRYEKYAKNLIDEYPITANILQEVSNHFQNKAKKEENEIKDIDYRQNQ